MRLPETGRDDDPLRGSGGPRVRARNGHAARGFRAAAVADVQRDRRGRRARGPGVLRGPSRCLLVAESGAAPLGFIYLEVLRDYFVGEEHGHIGILAVTEQAEGQGAGGALIRAAEAWARERGYRRLTLNVFEGNTRARAVYDHLGYRPETVRYVKLL
jgi:GNAT superfamily N-acetyltransferase